MKKITVLLIILLVTTIFAVAGWYLFLRNPEITATEVLRNILPFGTGDNTNKPIQTTDNNFENSPGNNTGEGFVDKFGSPTAPLFRLANTPVAGAVVFKKGQADIVRYVDRTTGHIYDIDLTTLVKKKVTNQTLPKIYEAYFSPNGNNVLMRSLKNDSDVVENLALTLTPPQGTSTEALHSISSTFLRGDITSVTVGKSNNALIYSLRDNTSIISSAFNGTGAKTLLNSPFTDWRLVTAGDTLMIHTKASAEVPGFAYHLKNTTNGGLTKILGPLNGLVAIPNATGNKVAYSSTDNSNTDHGGMSLVVKDLQSGTTSNTPLETIAEKCIWSIKNTSIIFCATPADWNPIGEPDNWYRGMTHFSDQIWLFDTSTEIARVLVESESGLGIKIDLVNPQLSPDENYLIFINKLDLSLWALRLTKGQ